MASGEVDPNRDPPPGPIETGSGDRSRRRAHAGAAHTGGPDHGDAAATDPPLIDLLESVETGTAAPATRSRWRIVWQAAAVVVAALSLQILAPTLIAVYTSIGDVTRINPLWLLVITGCEIASFVCLWELTRLAIHGGGRLDVARSQLVGNAASLVIPGGAATGAAVQMRMLTAAGLNRTAVASSLPVVALLTTASIFATPVFALPALLAVSDPARELVLAVWLGAVGAVLVGAVLAAFLATTRPVELFGLIAQAARNRLFRRRTPVSDLPQRLVYERDRIRRRLGEQWGTAVLMSLGKIGFDYFALLAALAAVGARPNPGLVLVAFTAAQVLRMIPITPGGLGFVEAGLTGTLALAGVGGRQAVLATAAYRFVSYFLPILAGAVAYAWSRIERRSQETLRLRVRRLLQRDS